MVTGVLQVTYGL